MSNLSFTSSHASRILNVVRGGLKPAGIDAHVTRSWYRCMKEYGIEPTAKRESAVLDPQTVREAQHRMGELLRVARAEMESLYDQIAGSGFAVILSDTQGAVMSTITDPTLQREFRQAGLWLGALWDEKHEGTNGIGTCLAEGCSVTVHREEHYRGYNVGLSCSGAPILDAHGSLLAVLDASSVNSNDSRLVQRHTMALVNMSANLISRWNFLNDFSHAWVLRFHSRPEFVGLLHEALIAVDGNGNILAVNESAMLQLGNSHRSAFVGQPVSHFFKFDFDTLEHRASHEPSTIWPVRDLAHGRRFFALVRAPLRAVMRAHALPAQDRQTESVAQVGKLSESKSHVSEDPLMRKNMICARQLFAKQVPILLQGATGTGKEAFARTLHRHSLWADKPFVTVNCAAIPESLIESELFGYTRGAFTGAAKDGRPGKILQSSSGTLFLDEIGDMPLMLQTRLLRVIEEREVVPLGSDRGTPVDLHVISATHRDIRQMIGAGEFREDLYYRLNGITLHLPLLRDRSDKAQLINTLLAEENENDPPQIAEDAFRKLLDYTWPGNIRQLRNALRTASALCRNGTIRTSNLPQEILDMDTPRAALAAPLDMPGQIAPTPEATHAPSAALKQAERDVLLRELERMRWNISRTAQALGISRNTLYRKIHKHGIPLTN